MKLKILEIFYSSDFFNLKFKDATKSLNSGVCSTLTAHLSWDQFKGLVATCGPWLLHRTAILLRGGIPGGLFSLSRLLVVW